MIPNPENIYVIDARSTKRARRLVTALNDMEAKGEGDTRRYARLKAEYDRLRAGNARKRTSGVTINVPRI